MPTENDNKCYFDLIFTCLLAAPYFIGRNKLLQFALNMRID
jgi:hypothetical protein